MAELVSVLHVSVVVPVYPSELADACVAGTVASIDMDGFSFDFLYRRGSKLSLYGTDTKRLEREVIIEGQAA